MGVTHALDTGTFVAISSQVTAREPVGGEHGSWWSHSGGSYIIDPLGRTIASVPDWEEGIAVADCDLSLIDDARLVWNAFSDDARDDLFGPGPVGDPVSALSAPLPAAGLAAGADGQVEAAPGQLALPSAEGAYEGAGHGD
jgi:hypothetical protein